MIFKLNKMYIVKIMRYLKKPSEHSNRERHLENKFEKWKDRASETVKSKLVKEGKKSIIIKFFLAPITLFLGIGFLYLILELKVFFITGGFMVAYFFPPLGKESVIPIAISTGLHPILIASVVAFLDIIAALFLLWNYDFVKLAPYLGPWMERFEKKGRVIATQKSWMKGIEFIGIMLFVMFPFQGSGGVGGTILGRIIGMNRYLVFSAISIGSFIGCLIIAYTSETIKRILFDNFQLGIFLICLILFFSGLYLYLKHKKNILEKINLY